MLRFFGALAAGVYCSAALMGFIALATGHVFHDSTWLSALPILVALGAPAGLVFARLSRRWLVPRARRRTLVFVLLGLAMLPLAVASSHASDTAVGVLVFAGSAVTGSAWLWHERRARASRHGRYMTTNG